MHIHTNESPCAYITLEETLIELTGIVDALVVTNHDTILHLAELEMKAFELKYNIQVLTPAVEISTYQGHLLAYGISSAPSHYIDVKEAIELVHAEGGVVVAAHPFALLGIGDMVYSLDLDALEINGSRSRRINRLAKEAAESMGLPLIGGSDSHSHYHIGSCVTEFSTKIKDMNDIISAIKEKKCKPLFISHRGQK